MMKQKNKTAVIYSGRFQMPHRGHIDTYQELCKQFDGEVWVAMSNLYDDSNSDSPFSFSNRKILLNACGVPENRIIQVKNPYIASEIVNNYCENSKIIFAVGEKDRDRFNFGPKLNGSLKYLQPYEEYKHDLKGQKQHAYVLFTPTKKYNVMGLVFSSASELRDYYRSLPTKDMRVKFADDLYGHGEIISDIIDSSLFQTIYSIDGVKSEGITFTYD